MPRSAARRVWLPVGAIFEPPCSLKWIEPQHSLQMGAFSYQVSGYVFAAEIGRYCSIGEGVQIGRQNHPLTWASTHPSFYLHEKLFDIGRSFDGSEEYHTYKPTPRSAPTRVQKTVIGHDVWIGHGAYIAAGVTVGHGAIVAAHAVVTKDVPAYAVVAGNPSVIKKFRLPAELVSPMLNAKWWHYAPWQIEQFDCSEPAKFLHQFMHHRQKDPYQPRRVSILESGDIMSIPTNCT